MFQKWITGRFFRCVQVMKLHLKNKQLKVRSHGTAAAAATATFSCHNNWIPQYLMDLFTLCSSGNSCSNGAAIKCIPTLFCVAVAVAKQQWQNILHWHCMLLCHCRCCTVWTLWPHCGKNDFKNRCRCRTVWTDLNTCRNNYTCGLIYYIRVETFLKISFNEFSENSK